MAIPVIRCSKCGHIFSIEIKQDRERQWLEINPDHYGCHTREDREVEECVGPNSNMTIT